MHVLAFLCAIDPVPNDLRRAQTQNTQLNLKDGYFEWRSGAPTTDLVVSDVAAEEDTGDAEGTGGEEGGAGAEGAKDETLSKTGSGDGVVSKTGSQTGSKVSQSKESKQKEEVEEGADPEGTKFVWHGPEEDPRWLDAFIWKPLNLVGPTAVKSAGATTTVNNFLMGRAKDPPKACLPKRNYLRTMTSVHAVTHKAVTVEYNDNVLAEANIHTTDWLTGGSAAVGVDVSQGEALPLRALACSTQTHTHTHTHRNHHVQIRPACSNTNFVCHCRQKGND